MKLLSLLMWVGQFGFSILFPLCLFLMIAYWLQVKFALGMWIYALCGVIGLLTSVSTVRSCLRSLRKAADEAADSPEPPVSFNNHD
ncbi:MAG: hypothetical protein Q4F17_07925 [Eubacteriales bacterium]|nr:hypothetical protein [Eubacteriales bacterium]